MTNTAMVMHPGHHFLHHLILKQCFGHAASGYLFKGSKTHPKTVGWHPMAVTRHRLCNCGYVISDSFAGINTRFLPLWAIERISHPA
jgi:hypothetical protein